MGKYTMIFNEIDKDKLLIVGGKGLNLGELSRIEGLNVPSGFCVTTNAYKKIIKNNEMLNILMEELVILNANEIERVSKISKEIRNIIEASDIPNDMEEEIKGAIFMSGYDYAYAVRSSATAEDLPTASFAGQQDTFLNIIGIDSVLYHIKKCWASLFTERAVVYRIQNGFDHRKVYLSVVVQQMVFPKVSGIMFTSDPVTSNRKVISIDAGYGLGEALVSGLVNPDIYKVRDGKIVHKKISSKKTIVNAAKEGGTVEREVVTDIQNMQTLTDGQILQLESIGRKIESYFGHPQDIEWCMRDDEFFIVQSRPITTLYPTPENDGKNRVYASMGHLQMMTEDIKPLGISFCKMLSFWFGENLTEAGGRLFIDGTYDLKSPVARKILIKSVGNADILMKEAILNIINQKEFVKSMPRGKMSINVGNGALKWIVHAFKLYLKNDISIVEERISYNDELINDMEQKIKKASGNELFEFILNDTKELKGILTGPKNMGVMVLAGMAPYWINKNMEKWLGVKNTADTLVKSVLNNVTTEMGLELMDLADAIRQYPKVIEYLHGAKDETFFTDIEKLEGGNAAAKAFKEYLEKYGMRCAGEIDITKKRWNEKPTALIPTVISNINNFGPDSSSAKMEQGMHEAEKMEQELLFGLEKLQGGMKKAKKTKKMIRLLRNVAGFREYPKYSFIKRFWIYKTALMKEADSLVKKGIISDREDVYYLYFEEFKDAVRTNHIDYSLIEKRKEEYKVFEKLTPPRVITSEGEVIKGKYNSGNIPKGALVGIPVSSGTVEGRARVILKMEDANIEEGDILVTSYTDPSWTALFVSVKGMVTEVGGLMTHGAVVTREYGLPGVVGVENATKLIKDGQMIRVNGTEGYVEIL